VVIRTVIFAAAILAGVVSAVWPGGAHPKVPTVVPYRHGGAVGYGPAGAPAGPTVNPYANILIHSTVRGR
jgi:hypothetical protein